MGAKASAFAVAFIASAVVVTLVEAFNRYRETISEELEKRAKIQQWEAENLACIDAANKRLRELARDPNVTPKQYLEAWTVEMRYLDIVASQPMY